MRTVVAALVVWSAFALLLLLFDPGGSLVIVPCARLVGERTPECQAQLANASAIHASHQAQLLLAIASGYVAIAVLTAVKLVRSRIEPMRIGGNG